MLPARSVCRQPLIVLQTSLLCQHWQLLPLRTRGNELSHTRATQTAAVFSFQIRSRVDVIRYVVKHGLLWDDLYIGFQTRLQRDPDIYHHL